MDMKFSLLVRIHKKSRSKSLVIYVRPDTGSIACHYGMLVKLSPLNTLIF